MYNVEVLLSARDEDIQKMVELGKKIYPEQWDAVHEADYVELLNDPESIVIVLRKGKEFEGQLIAVPHDAIALDEEMKKADPLLKEDPKRYYVERMGIIPEISKTLSGGKMFFRMLEAMFIEAEERKGIEDFSMHARVSNGLSAVVNKKYIITSSRRIENWPFYGGLEPVEYIEVTSPRYRHK